MPLWRFFANSFFIAIMAVIGTVLSSALAAYAFARIQFRGVGVLFAAMIGTLLLPFHVIIIPQYIMFNKLDLVDTYCPLILPKFLATEAFFVFLIVQFIRNIPRDMDEAARIDGAGHIRIFWSIILPLIKPALITSAIFTFIWTWNDFLGPAALPELARELPAADRAAPLQRRRPRPPTTARPSRRPSSHCCRSCSSSSSSSASSSTGVATQGLKG